LLGAWPSGSRSPYELLVSRHGSDVASQPFRRADPGQNLIEGANSFTLLAVPFFLLAGEIMNVGGCRSASSTWRSRWSPCQGRARYVAIIAACLLAPCRARGRRCRGAHALLLPMMVKAGHDKARSAGLLAAGGIIRADSSRRRSAS